MVAPTPSPFRPEAGLFLIAGPCVLEDDDLNRRVASHLAEVSDRHAIPVIFKASFDKANRTSGGSQRGPGLARGLELLNSVRAETDLPVLTDVHLPHQIPEAAETVDVLQVPAFLCRQTDLLEAAGASGLPVNIKKGQWMAPEQIAHAVEKVRVAGAIDVAVTERGFAFGYGRWIVDMRSFGIMRAAAGCPTVFDATHAVQLPGGQGEASGGEPEFIEPLSLAAISAGADALFLEVHPDPASAPSDAASMLPLDRLDSLVARVRRLREALEMAHSSPTA
jgi:2-dehydro-3-deoxyphosphooctonate aldolase (KDO 8-P synthase)